MGKGLFLQYVMLRHQGIHLVRGKNTNLCPFLIAYNFSWTADKCEEQNSKAYRSYIRTSNAFWLEKYINTLKCTDHKEKKMNLEFMKNRNFSLSKI